jgi:hypothetical protein
MDEEEKQRLIDDRISRWSIILSIIYFSLFFPVFITNSVPIERCAL